VSSLRVFVFVVLVAMLVSACGGGPLPAPAMTAMATTATPATSAPTTARETATVSPTAPLPTPSRTPAARGTWVSPAPTATLRVTAAPTLTETMGILSIPALDRDVVIVSVGWGVHDIDGAQVALWETVKGAAGHHRGTASLGGDGNCVLGGHSGPDQDAVFAGLWDLAIGDALLVTDELGDEFLYRVISVETVQETGASLDERLAHAAVMDPTDDARLTLITCWPEWAYTHRVVVVALREEVD